MISESIDATNIAGIDFDDNHFKLCLFEKLPFGAMLLASSDFVDCTFTSVDWYWNLFSFSNFVACTFQDCSFAGTHFVDTRFVECTFANCTFKQDNMGGECKIANCTAYACTLTNCIGLPTEFTEDKGWKVL